MHKSVWAFCLIFGLILVAASSAEAQYLEYGKPAEMNGLRKVFVETGGDIKNRDRITSEIEKASLGLTLLDSEDGAEIILSFGAGKDKIYSGSSSTIYNDGQNVSSTARYRNILTGAGQIIVVKEGHYRVVASFEDDQKNIFEKKPATNFAKTFIKAYKKANGSR